MYKIFLCGIENAGKTSIINMIKKLPNPGETSPTLSFLVAQVVLDLTEFVIWDAPGQTRFRNLWKDNLHETSVVCYVMDVTQEDRYIEAKELLDDTLNECEDKSVPLIICFHKLDLPNSNEFLPKIKEIFKPEFYKDHAVQYLETTIFNPDSIMELKTAFVKTVEDKM